MAGACRDSPTRQGDVARWCQPARSGILTLPDPGPQTAQPGGGRERRPPSIRGTAPLHAERWNAARENGCPGQSTILVAAFLSAYRLMADQQESPADALLFSLSDPRLLRPALNSVKFPARHCREVGTLMVLERCKLAARGRGGRPRKAIICREGR